LSILELEVLIIYEERGERRILLLLTADLLTVTAALCHNWLLAARGCCYELLYPAASAEE